MLLVYDIIALNMCSSNSKVFMRLSITYMIILKAFCVDLIDNQTYCTIEKKTLGMTAAYLLSSMAFM